MKKRTKDVIKNFTIEVLDFILGIPESYIYAFDRKEFYRLMKGYPSEKALTCSNIAGIISNLKKRNYIEIERSAYGESIRFTNKAKLAVVDTLANKIKSEGQYYLISFDIPEELRYKRDRFRIMIKRIGFKQIQKSLWVCNKPVGELVELAAEEYGVKGYVVYIVSEYTNIDTTIKQLLKYIHDF